MMRTALLLLFMGGTAWAQPQPVTISHGWARATLPHQDTGVAYLTMVSQAGDSLTGVDAPKADMAMLHQTTVTNGVSQMRDVDALDLPAGKLVALAPNGTHIMLMGLKTPLRAGQKLHLVLTFRKAGKMAVDVPVLPVGATPPP